MTVIKQGFLTFCTAIIIIASLTISYASYDQNCCDTCEEILKNPINSTINIFSKFNNDYLIEFNKMTQLTEAQIKFYLEKSGYLKNVTQVEIGFVQKQISEQSYDFFHLSNVILFAREINYNQPTDHKILQTSLYLIKKISALNF